jgi:hypothetical protein
MTRYLILAGCLVALAACDRAPQKPIKTVDVDAPADVVSTSLSKSGAMAEIYGNVDPVFATSVWTMADPNAVEPASFDSVEGIAMLVEVANLTKMGPNRALIVTAARPENPKTGEADRCNKCQVLLSAFTFERDKTGWRILERKDAAAATNETELISAINVLLRDNGAIDLTLAGTALRFDNKGRIISVSAK